MSAPMTTADMVSFDAGGNTRWIVPNDTPQIATADGGVIGQSGITYDQNGNATGEMASLPIQSWTGNIYQYGSVDQLAGIPVSLAAGFWSYLAFEVDPAAAQPLPDLVKAVYDVVSPDPLGSGAFLRSITYLPYQGARLAVASQGVVITEKLKYSGKGQQPQPSATNPGVAFYDEVGTRGKGDFNLTQQFFLGVPQSRIRNYQVKIVPCIATNTPGTPYTFGTPVEQNVIKATAKTVLINEDPCSPEARTCK